MNIILNYLVGLNHGAPSAIQLIRDRLVVDARLLLGAVLDEIRLSDMEEDRGEETGSVVEAVSVPGSQPSSGSSSGGKLRRLHAGPSEEEGEAEDDDDEVVDWEDAESDVGDDDV